MSGTNPYYIQRRGDIHHTPISCQKSSEQFFPPSGTTTLAAEHPLGKLQAMMEWNTAHQFSKRRTFLFYILLLWVGILWTSLLYKHASTGWIDILKYYTNLTFTIQAVYYTVYLFVFLEDPDKRVLERILLVGFFWVVFSQIILVFFMVLGVLYDAPELVVGEMKSAGGEYDDGLVLTIERLFHVFPFFVAIIYLFITWNDIADCLIISLGYFTVNTCYNNDKEHVSIINQLHDVIKNSADAPGSDTTATTSTATMSEVRRLVDTYSRVVVPVRYEFYAALVYATTQYIMSCLPFFLYMGIIDLEDQYNISPSLARWPPVAAVLFFNVFSVAVPIGFMFSKTVAGRFLTPYDLEKILSSACDEDIVHLPYTNEKRLYVASVDGLDMRPT